MLAATFQQNLPYDYSRKFLTHLKDKNKKRDPQLLFVRKQV